MKELLKGPGFMGTAATLGADLSQVMAMLFTGLFIIGWVQARKKMRNAHHRLVLGGMVAMLAFFTSYYLFRQLGVLAFEGKEGFGGSDFMYHQVFIPLLTFHISLVIVGLIVVGLVLGVEKTVERFWPDGGKRHRALGRFTMVIYCILFVTGSVTYTMLYILYPGKIG